MRNWLSSDAEQPDDAEAGWGVPLWWGAVVVAVFTIAISWCNDPSDQDAVAVPSSTTIAPTTTVALVPPGTSNLVDLMGEQADLSFFRSLIAVAGIEEVLATNGPFTFFAPNDAAFAALPDDIREAMTSDPGIANQVLQRHAAFSVQSAADLVAAGGTVTITEQPVLVSQTDGTTFIDEAALVESDLQATNGIVHVIDGVLGLGELPTEPTAPEAPPVNQLIGDRSDLTTLTTALGAVEGDLFGSAAEGFTVFAPTDDAFGSLPSGSVEVLLATQPKLFELLGYHVVPGTVLAADLTDGQVLTTASGAELPVVIADGVITVGGSAITEADLTGGNGVVHIVEGVLIPPDYSLPTLNEALALEPITFESGSAVITADGIAVLQGAVDFLTANADVRVAIEGHTDAQGAETSNQALSESRAASVRDYLVSQGIDADRMETAGFGESNPIASNDTAEGRAENRRIEFRLL
ncbi:MAG: OmpA family protein [bacterium]|nr:OmpA family protein [bacterium]